MVVGFGVDPEDVLGEGWYVCLEEPFTEPRVGLDEPDAEAPVYGKAPTETWEDLTWSHVAQGPAKYAAMTHVDLGAATWLDGVELDDLTWGRNSAHMAGITFQRPFRFVIAAGDLIGGAVSVFDELDEALPLVLLPVRLVTRFHRPRGPRAAPTHLHVRIHPDVIHADSHDPALTEHELVLGKGFWARVQAAGDDEAAIADARSWLAAQLDPYRALWVAGADGPEPALAPAAQAPAGHARPAPAGSAGWRSATSTTRRSAAGGATPWPPTFRWRPTWPSSRRARACAPCCRARAWTG